MLLAIDTSSHAPSVAVAEPSGKIRASRSYPSERARDDLLGLIDESMRGANIGRESVSTIAYCVGPGSFTGVRIGASVAHGFAQALGVPVIGVSKLMAYLFGGAVLPEPGLYLVTTAPNSSEILCGVFSVPLNGPPCEISPLYRIAEKRGEELKADVQQRLIEGGGLSRFGDGLDNLVLCDVPDDASLAEFLVRYTMRTDQERSEGGEPNLIYGKGVTARTMAERASNGGKGA